MRLVNSKPYFVLFCSVVNTKKAKKSAKIILKTATDYNANCFWTSQKNDQTKISLAIAVCILSRQDFSDYYGYRLFDKRLK